NIFLWQHHILGSRAEGALPLRVHHPHPLTDTVRIDSFAYRMDNAGTVTMRNDHRKRQTSATTAQTRLPVRWVHTRDVHTHADFTRTRRWRVDLANVQDISGSTELGVIGSAHAFSSAYLDGNIEMLLCHSAVGHALSAAKLARPHRTVNGA